MTYDLTYVEHMWKWVDFHRVSWWKRACWILFTPKFHLRCLAHTCTHSWNRLVFTQCYKGAGKKTEGIIQIDFKFQEVKFWRLSCTLNSVLCGISHTLIIVWESMYARSHLGSTRQTMWEVFTLYLNICSMIAYRYTIVPYLRIHKLCAEDARKPLFFKLLKLKIYLKYAFNAIITLHRDWLGKKNVKWAGKWQKAHLKLLRGAIGGQNKAKERKPPILRGAQNCSPIAIKGTIAL